MNLSQTTPHILTRDVDLDGVESLLFFMNLGFSLSSKFKVLKADRRGDISKAAAEQLKSTFSELMRGLSKSQARALIPAFLIGLVVFSKETSTGVPIATRLQAFKTYIQRVKENTLADDERGATLQILHEGFSQSYYKDKLNPTLDSVSSVFNGQTPNSFTNAVNELTAKITPDPITPPAPKRPTLTIAQSAPPALTVVETETPTFEIVPPKSKIRSAPETEDEVPENPPETPPETTKKTPLAIYGIITVAALAGVALIFSKKGSR
jgi:hypothetical protein